MARDVKWAVDEACNQQKIVKVSIEQDEENKVLSKAKKDSIKMLLGSLVFAAVVIGVAFAIGYFFNLVIIGVKTIFLLLIALCFPFYAVYNIFATAGAVKKGDYGFYSATLVGKSDKGYHVAGLEDIPVSYLYKEPQDAKAGDSVILVRVREDLNLLDNRA